LKGGMKMTMTLMKKKRMFHGYNIDEYQAYVQWLQIYHPDS